MLFEHEWYAGNGFKPVCIIKQSDEKSAAHLTYCPLCGIALIKPAAHTGGWFLIVSP